MLHAAATFIGLFIASLILVEPLAGRDALAFAAAIGASGTLIGARLGGPPASFTHALLGVNRYWSACVRLVSGALKTIRTAFAADVSMRPALTRVSVRSSARDRARVAHALGAAPGAIVVDIDEGALLVHVTHETEDDIGELGRLARDASGGRS